ncbi:MAG: aconitate hydratase [Spirochaetes bacterium]|nr:aconitate hydratase [Spirochaetota bacterium]
MGQSLTYKILKNHLVEGELKTGSEIGIRIDQTLTQDATGTMAYLQFEAMEIPRVKTDLSVSYVDHNTLQMGFENADDHKYLMTMNNKYGIHYSKAGNGICHQVHVERFGKPGATLLGSDSHTPTGGGIGMIAIGAGGLDVAVAMGGGPFYMTCPKVINVKLEGQLRPWVSAKDVILKVLEVLTTKGNVGCVVEYSGGGVSHLSVPERATITNMGAELGVTTSLFPSDDITKEFLKAQQREDKWSELKADEDATYEQVIEINLGELKPRVACPHSPDNIKLVSELDGLKVDQVAIGSCTNASYKDLMTAASILKGKKVSPDVSLIVAPGSKQVFEMIARNGALSDLIAAGARVMESACGFCIGAGQAPITEGVSIRTNNRNFEGRSGTKSAGIYLVSPETAAVTAIKGVLTDPSTLPESDYPQIEIPENFVIDDSMILKPDFNGEVFRGPNIGDPPFTEPLAKKIAGKINLKVGDKITTDHIMPAGVRLKYRSNVPAYSRYVFEGVDPEFSTRAAADKEKGIFSVIVAGASYGQGSSREHAAICPMYLGVRAVVAKSFERIHSANLINFDIVPLVFKSEADYETVKQGDDFVIDDIRDAVDNGAETVTAKCADKKIELSMILSKRQRDILLAGGLLNYTKAQV